jgi:hypothetical protein
MILTANFLAATVVIDAVPKVSSTGQDGRDIEDAGAVAAQNVSV